MGEVAVSEAEAWFGPSFRKYLSTNPKPIVQVPINQENNNNKSKSQNHIPKGIPEGTVDTPIEIDMENGTYFGNEKSVLDNIRNNDTDNTSYEDNNKEEEEQGSEIFMKVDFNTFSKEYLGEEDEEEKPEEKEKDPIADPIEQEFGNEEPKKKDAENEEDEDDVPQWAKLIDNNNDDLFLLDDEEEEKTKTQKFSRLRKQQEETQEGSNDSFESKNEEPLDNNGKEDPMEEDEPEKEKPKEEKKNKKEEKPKKKKKSKINAKMFFDNETELASASEDEGPAEEYVYDENGKVIGYAEVEYIGGAKVSKSKKSKKLSDADLEDNVCTACEEEEARYECGDCEEYICEDCKNKSHVGHNLTDKFEDLNDFIVDSGEEEIDEDGEGRLTGLPLKTKTIEEEIEEDTKELQNFWKCITAKNVSPKCEDEPSKMVEDIEDDTPSQSAKKRPPVNDEYFIQQSIASAKKKSASMKELAEIMNQEQDLASKITTLNYFIASLEHSDILTTYSEVLLDIKEQHGKNSIRNSDFSFLVQYTLSIAMDVIANQQNEKLVLSLIVDEEKVNANRSLKERIDNFHKDMQIKVKGFYDTVANHVSDNDRNHYTQLSNNLSTMKQKNAKIIYIIYGYIINSFYMKHTKIDACKKDSKCAITGDKIPKGSPAYLLTVFSLFSTGKSGMINTTSYWYIKVMPGEHEDVILNIAYALWNYRLIGRGIKEDVKAWIKNQYPTTNPKDKKDKQDMIIPMLNKFLDDKEFVKKQVQKYIYLCRITKSFIY